MHSHSGQRVRLRVQGPHPIPHIHLSWRGGGPTFVQPVPGNLLPQEHTPAIKKAAGINKSPQVVDYFKEPASATGRSYQRVIGLCLLDCAKKRKKLTMKWVAQRRLRAMVQLELLKIFSHSA